MYTKYCLSEKAPTNRPTLNLFKKLEFKRTHSVDSNNENVKVKLKCNLENVPI